MMENKQNDLEEIEISDELKSSLDNLKQVYGFEDYNELILFLIEQARKEQ